MKKLFCLICVAMFAVTASAQVTWNMKGGFGVATCYGSDTDGLKSHLVGKIGVGLEYPLSSNVSLMPSLEFAWKGTEMKDDDFKTTLDLYYLQVPVVFAYRMNLADAWNMTLKAGPYFAYAVSDKYKMESSYGNYDGSAEVKKFDAGLDAGIDFEYHRFVFGVEAELGFLKLDGDSNVKNLAFYATLGWKF
jgi:hypothetical protein